MRRKESGKGLWAFQGMGQSRSSSGLPKASAVARLTGERSRRWMKSGLIHKRWFWQAAVSCGVLLAIVAVFCWPGQRTARVKQVVRQYVVEDYGLSPVLSFMDTVMTWGDALEQPASYDLPAASQISLPTDGRLVTGSVVEDGKLPEETLTSEVMAGNLAQEESHGAAGGDQGLPGLTGPTWSAEAAADEVAVAAGAAADSQGVWIATQPGSNIRAAMAGKISDLGQTQSGAQWFFLDSGLGWSFRYSNCQDLQVAVGDGVEQGQLLGKTAALAGPGQTGEEGGLYVQVYHEGQALDPTAFFLGGV